MILGITFWTNDLMLLLSSNIGWFLSSLARIYLSTEDNVSFPPLSPGELVAMISSHCRACLRGPRHARLQRTWLHRMIINTTCKPYKICGSISSCKHQGCGAIDKEILLVLARVKNKNKK